MFIGRRVVYSIVSCVIVVAIVVPILWTGSYCLQLQVTPTTSYPVSVEINGIDIAINKTTLGIPSDVARAYGTAEFTTDEPTLDGITLDFELRDHVLYPDGYDNPFTQHVTGQLVVGDDNGKILLSFEGESATGEISSYRAIGNLSHLSLVGNYLFLVEEVIDDGIVVYKIKGWFEGTLTSS